MSLDFSLTGNVAIVTQARMGGDGKGYVQAFAPCGAWISGQALCIDGGLTQRACA